MGHFDAAFGNLKRKGLLGSEDLQPPPREAPGDPLADPLVRLGLLIPPQLAECLEEKRRRGALRPRAGGHARPGRSESTIFSNRKATSMPKAVIYVSLLDEGVKVWRPVPADELGGDLFLIHPTADYDPRSEAWEFPPGTRVRCEPTRVSDGTILAAVQRVD